MVAEASGQVVSRSGQFPSTHWSCIDRARLEGAAGARPALTELLRSYQPALRTYLRGPEDRFMMRDLSRIHFERDPGRELATMQSRSAALRGLADGLDRYVSRRRRARHARKRTGRGVRLETFQPAAPAATWRLRRVDVHGRGR